MAIFGTVAVTNQAWAFNRMYQGAVAHGYTPADMDERGILSAIIASWLQDSVAAPALTVGSGTQMTKFVVYSVSLVPTQTSLSIVTEQSFTVTGITTGDAVYVNPPAVSNNVAAVSWRVNSSGILIGAFACRGASATAASGTHKIAAFTT